MYENMNPYYKQNVPTFGINWVKGYDGVKSVVLPLNGSGIFLDQDNEGIFYIKTSDNAGMCNVRTFKFEEIIQNKNNFDDSQYVKKDEIEVTVANILNKLLGGNDSVNKSVSTAESAN